MQFHRIHRFHRNEFEIFIVMNEKCNIQYIVSNELISVPKLYFHIHISNIKGKCPQARDVHMKRIMLHEML